jgi:hypothetical protein
MVKYDKQCEPIVTSKALFDVFYDTPNSGDLIALYMHYYYVAKWQETNIAYSTTNYTAKGLYWSEHKVRQTKKVLISLGLIEDITTKDKTGKINGHFIYVRFVFSDEKVKEAKKIAEKTTLTKLHSVANRKANALSSNNRNALSTNKEPICTRTKNFLSFLPLLFQQDVNFVESWNDFVQHRKTMKPKPKPLNELSAKRCITKLKQLSNSDINLAIKIIDQTIEKSNDTFWPLLTIKSNKQTNNFYQQNFKKGDLSDLAKVKVTTIYND